LILCACDVLAQESLEGEGQECKEDCAASAGCAGPTCAGRSVGLHPGV
jgi:hypothetical protein